MVDYYNPQQNVQPSSLGQQSPRGGTPGYPMRTTSPSNQPNNPVQVQSDSSGNSNMGLIFGIVGGVFLFILLVAIVLFFMLFDFNVNLDSDDLASGKTIKLVEEQKALFEINGEEHSVTLDNIRSNSVEVTIRSTPISETLEGGDEYKFDLDDDDIYDLSLKLISFDDESAEIRFKRLAEKVCEPEWDCDDWNECSEDGIQTRICVDSNDCDIDEDKPIEERECEYIEPCVENWNCTNWSECVDGNQTRNCTDLNDCGTNESKPVEIRECEILEGDDVLMCGNISYPANQNMPLDNNESQCFNLSLQSCLNSTFLVTQYDPSEPSSIIYQTYFEIFGENNNLCLTYLNEFDSSSTEEYEDYICTFPKNLYPNSLNLIYCIELSYYDNLETECGTDSCCLNATNVMRNFGYYNYSTTVCEEDNFREGNLSCSSSPQWCEMFA